MLSNLVRSTAILFLATAFIGTCGKKSTNPHVYDPFPQQLYEVSADSHYVYFRDNGTAFGRPAGIYRFRLDGDKGIEPVIIHPSVYFPRVSPSGKQLAFVDIANALIIRDLDVGSDSVILNADVVDIDWYNEDTLVCGVYAGEVVVVEAATGNASVIWTETGTGPTVSAQGIVAFIRHMADGAIVDSSLLSLSNLHGDSLGDLTIFRDEYSYAPDWNGAGDRIAVVRDWFYGSRIASVSWPGGQVTDSLALFATDPFFNSEGRILYVRLGDKNDAGRDPNDSETDQIWIMYSDGSNKELLMK